MAKVLVAVVRSNRAFLREANLLGYSHAGAAKVADIPGDPSGTVRYMEQRELLLDWSAPGDLTVGSRCWYAAINKGRPTREPFGDAKDYDRSVAVVRPGQIVEDNGKDGNHRAFIVKAVTGHLLKKPIGAVAGRK